MGTPIVHCSVADPYILIMSEEGSIMMLVLKQEGSGSTARLVLSKPLVSNVSQFCKLYTLDNFLNMFMIGP